MKRALVLIVILSLLTTMIFSDEVADVMAKLVLTESKELIELPTEAVIPDRAQYLEVNRTYLQHTLSNTVLWLTYNAVHESGWSWTGYSIGRVDDQFRRSRWKFGLIGGETELFRNASEPALHYRYENENPAIQHQGLIGVQFMKEF